MPILSWSRGKERLVKSQALTGTPTVQVQRRKQKGRAAHMEREESGPEQEIERTRHAVCPAICTKRRCRCVERFKSLWKDYH